MNDDPGVSRLGVRRWADGQTDDTRDDVIIEAPLEIRLVHGHERSAVSISVTMRTPGEDAELAAGFLFTERVIESPEHIRGIESCGPLDADTGHQNVVRVTLAPEVVVDLERLRRNVYTTSSCGVCGKTSIEAVTVGARAIVSDITVEAQLLARLPDMLRGHQARFAATGGAHAAALFDPQGGMLLLREDVGRHNAVDKVIGSAIMEGSPDLARCILVLSGRAGFELVQKAAVAGIPVVIAVGAPSNLSVALARSLGLSLAGFARTSSFVVYADGAGRIR